MQRKNQMRQIQEQTQEAQSISLNSQSSVIEQYNQLQFSDEIQREQNSSSDAQLSLDKLKFLGIDRFPGQYAFVLNKNNENSETREDLSKKQINGIRDSFSEQSRMENWLYSRKKRREKNKQILTNEPVQQQKQQYFNIDSFLNSKPMHKRRPTQKLRQEDHNSKYINKSHNLSSNYGQFESQRTKHNSNEFKKILQEQNKTKKERKSYLLEKEPQFKAKKQERSIYEERNKRIKQFVDQSIRKQHKILHQSYKNSFCQQSQQQSITLITLPQPKQPPHRAISNKNKKSQSLHHQDHQQMTQDQLRQVKMFQIRFEQAKIGFIDCFLPESMKIGNNPYNFLKYTNSKPERYLRMI